MADILDWMSLAQPSAEWEVAVKQMPQRPDLGAFPDIAALRQYIIESKKRMTATFEPISGVQERDHETEMRDGATITIRVYAPEGKSECPLIVVFHGGGWCIGGLENEELLCRRAASSLGCVVVNVDYRLAPESKFPTAVHDAYDSTKWACDNAASLGADLSKGFIVTGTSAGGNLAAVVALQCRDEKLGAPLTGCHLMIPSLCSDAAIPEKYKPDYRSWDQNEHADILSRKACQLLISNYVRTHEDAKDPELSPLLWSTGLAGLPPTSFQICGADPLRDEALIFERILRNDLKIKTRVDIYPGMPHGFFSVVPTLPTSKKYTDDSIEALKWLLAQ